MYLTIVTLTAPSPTAAMLSRGELLRIVLDAAAPGDALEHLSIQIVPGRVFLGVFTTCVPADERVRRARRLCLRAVADAKRLHGWNVVEVSAAASLGGEAHS